MFGIDHVYCDCGSSPSLQTVTLDRLSTDTASSILSTLASREISAVTLERVAADGIADVDSLAARLVSEQFTSLPRLNRVGIEIRPTAKWRVRLGGTIGERKQDIENEMDGLFSKLRGVFGVRVYTGICWDQFEDGLSDK